MRASSRVFINTGALYIKLIITTIVNLYLTRVVLSVVGIDDFGIYSLIAGVVNLLAFLSGSLMGATQRYLSVAIGQSNFNYLRKIFSISLKLYLLLAVVMLILLEILTPILFDGIFNIAPERLSAAKVVYQLMILSVVCTIVTSPYNAILNAYEHLWFYAIVEAICAMLKLGLIFVLSHACDALIIYTAWIFLVTITNFIIKFMWCRAKYKEIKSCMKISVKDNISLIKEMGSYIGWNSLASFSVVGRDQGTAVVLNIFFSTVINGVVGIANQVRGLFAYFSTMLTSSITPQIMKRKGEGNIEKMLILSIFTCKLSFALSAILAIPILLNLPFILDIWLKDVPQYTIIYCRLIIFAFLTQQLYPGLNRAILAEGNIKFYQITISVLLLLPLVIAPVLFYLKFTHYTIFYLIIFAEILSMTGTALFAYKLLHFDLKKYLHFVFLSVLIFLSIYMLGFFCNKMIYNKAIVLGLMCPVLTGLFVGLYYSIVLDSKEKNAIKNLFIR
jgi:O-antigen/teichoic acid export membrane protein